MWVKTNHFIFAVIYIVTTVAIYYSYTDIAILIDHGMSPQHSQGPSTKIVGWVSKDVGEPGIGEH